MLQVAVDSSNTAAEHSRPSVTEALMVILSLLASPDSAISEDVPTKLTANWLDMNPVQFAGFVALSGESAAPSSIILAKLLALSGMAEYGMVKFAQVPAARVKELTVVFGLTFMYCATLQPEP